MASPAIQSQQALEHSPAVSPLREVWTIAWPTVLTMTSYTVMQFIDALMIGQVGAVELAAQSNGGMWAWALIAYAMGLLTVVNTYVSQNLGAGTPENGPRYAWAALWLSAIIWALVMIPFGLLLPWVFSLMQGHSERLQSLESGYGQILLFGSIILMASRGINQFFFGMHWPRVVTAAALLGNVANVVGNYVLIYGEVGLPRFGLPGVPGVPALGVYGAGIATVVGTAVEFVIPFAIFLGPKLNKHLQTRRAWRAGRKPALDLVRIGWPASLQFGNEVICWAIFMAVLVGYFGEAHMAACAIAFKYMSLSFMPAVGFSVATNSLVGKYIGARRPDIAVARTRLALALAMTYMTACAAIFLLFRHELVAIFTNHTEGGGVEPSRVIDIGAKLLICTAVFQTFDSIGVIYTGALRGAGDTVWPGIITLIYSWVIIVAGGAAMVWLWPELESVGPWLAAAAYIILYGMTMWRRFASGRWRAIRLLQEHPEPALAAAAPIPDVAEPIALHRNS
jgi:MATE family multidrug resistance protein